MLVQNARIASNATPLEARVTRFRELIDKGRPYKVYELVLEELRLLTARKNRHQAAYEAHMSAGFYDLKELDIDHGYKIWLPRSGMKMNPLLAYLG